MAITKVNLRPVKIGIAQSPLEHTVKLELMETVEKHADEIIRLLTKGRYVAPEEHFETLIASYVINLVRPILQDRKVSEPNIVDTRRHINEAIRSEGEVNNEATQYFYF